jgi:ATP phosphoribosyltransferase regulatory subunit
VIERFFAVEGDPDAAAAELWKLSEAADIDLAPALDLFETRTGLLAARGIDTRRIKFATAFGRGLDYYTGFVFELYDPQGRADGQLVAGGRYDGLFARLGCVEPIAAVGFAAWIERLAGTGGGR